MDTDTLVRSWKDLDARGDARPPHPAGEIKLDLRPRVGARAALLAGLPGRGSTTVVGPEDSSTCPTTLTSLSLA